MRRGQGLLETIVALGVIMTGLVSVIALTISNLNSEREAAVQYQAVNFAREGLELTRNLRDSNWLGDQNTWEGIPAGATVALQFDPVANLLSLSLVGDVRSTLTQIAKCGDDPYVQGSACAENTPFSRTLTIASRNCRDDGMFTAGFCQELNERGRLSNPVAYQIISRVDWQSHGAMRQVELSETLYDWR